MNPIKIVSEFNKGVLPKSKWNHKAHLIVSVWYCLNYDSESVLKKLRKSIKAYNEKVGTRNNENEGYHETITCFWIWQTNQFLINCKSENFVEICERFTSSEKGNKKSPLQYYSKEVLLSVKARMQWVAPDISSYTN